MFYITPHPPLIVGNIGGGREKEVSATIDGLKKIAAEIAEKKPKTIAVVTPHGNVFSDALCINTEDALLGDFGAFGYPEIKLTFEGDALADALVQALTDSEIPCVAMDRATAKRYRVNADVDHGALVPLWFIKKVYDDFKLIHINIGFLSKRQLYLAGKIIADMLGDENVLVISGDLSHRLTQDAPAGFDKAGAVYDKIIVNAVKEGKFMEILDMDEDLLERAGQCAQKPLELLLGAFDGYTAKTKVFSYEGPFGVGYMTASLTRADKAEVSLIDAFEAKENERVTLVRKEADEYVTLARMTIESFVAGGVKPPVPKNLEAALYTEKKGAFVSIKKEGQLRGCIGTIEPVRDCLAEEIIENAISAATRDPRFPPIDPTELKKLEISVDVLSPPEDISGKDQLDVKEYGVIVSKGFRRGLLLPNLEGVDSVDKQISIALEKAGIRPDEGYTMQRFKVVRHK